MRIQANVPLRPYNTFGIEANAAHFVTVTNPESLAKILGDPNFPRKIILGGGSNILIVNDLDALVVHIASKGIEEVARDADCVWIKVQAGENWHQLVLWTLDNDFGGLENLSLIPGNAGTAPIQNIGAYGVELKDRFVSCEAIDLVSGDLVDLDHTACRFGYRDSLFKNEGKGRYIIVSVTLKLTVRDHELHTDYGDIQGILRQKDITAPTIRDVSNAIIEIRRSKLPDPRVLGNSGSFFKNPIISKKEFEVFQEAHPNAPSYKTGPDAYKIPAGWLIEQCGYKGMREGDAGVHDRQALVLVNYGHATGRELLALANKIINAVYKRFGITLTPEVNIIK